MNRVIPWYIYCSYDNAEFVGNEGCCQALDWSAEEAYSAETGFWVNQTIITIFTSLLHHCYDSKYGSVIIYLYILIITLLLPVITVIMEHYYLLLLK